MGSRSSVVAFVFLAFSCSSTPATDAGAPEVDAGASDAGGTCVFAQACTPPDEVCHVGGLLCPFSICSDTGAFAPVGTPCGAGFVCQPDGQCSGRLTLTKVSGDDQHVFPFQRLPAPAVVRLTDQTGRPIAGERIDFVPSSGMVVTPAFAVTDSDGRAQTSSIRVGLSGYSPLTARGPMNTSAAFTVVFDPLPPGTVFDLVGEDRAAGHDGDGNLAPEGHVGEVRGIDTHWGTGTLYFADDCTVRAMSSLGFLSTVAGDGTCGDSGDGAAATLARLDRPTGLAVEVDGRRLFIGDSHNDRVRVVDLTTGVISTFAGGGTAAAPGFGDQGDARSAALSRPGWVGLFPERNSLVIADTGHDRVREVDLGSGIITTVLRPTGTCTDPVAFVGCGGELGCSFAWSLVEANIIPRDHTFVVAGRVCGTRVGGSSPGVVRVDVESGGVDHVAGVLSGLGATELRRTQFQGLPLLAGGTHPGDQGSVALADSAGHRLWSAEATTGLLTPGLGDGTAASLGNYVLGTGARVSRPTGLSTFQTTVYVGDGDGHALRALNVLTVPRKLEVTALGGSETVFQMQATTQPFRAQVSTLTGGLPVPAVTVDWESTPGFGGRCRPVPPSAMTDDAGVSAVGVRVGLESCGLAPTVRRLHPPLSGSRLSKFASFIPSGQIATFVNERGLPAEGPSPELGVLATLPAPRAVAEWHFVAGCAVRVFDFNGWVSTLAGDPANCGFSGDNGPALSARLSAVGDLSVSGDLIYVADTGNDRIRKIDLQTGLITTVAGGGTGAPAADGDGAAATLAVLSRPEHVLFVAATGKLYIADNGHNRIRVVDSNGIINALVSPTSCNGKQAAFVGCTGPRSCAMAETGVEIYLAATICGSGPGGTTTGIIRLNGSTAAHVAGRVGGTAADGTLATQLALQGDLALSNAFDLYFTESATHRVRKIDSFSRAVTTVAGSGTAGFSGDYGPPLSARLTSPEGLWVSQGRGMLIADTGNNAVRWVAF